MPIENDPNISPMRRRAIEKLLERRKALRDQCDALASAPASYGITGSVNVTNRTLAELKAELAQVDAQIARLLGGNPNGLNLSYPDYAWRWA